MSENAGAKHWIVIDNNENPWGPFDSQGAARTWAEKKWPDLEWSDEGAVGGYWEILPLRVPA